MSPDKMSRTKCRGQRVVDNMSWTKWHGQNDEVKMFWSIYSRLIIIDNNIKTKTEISEISFYPRQYQQDILTRTF